MRGCQAGMGEITAHKVRVYEAARKAGLTIEQALAKAKAA